MKLCLPIKKAGEVNFGYYTDGAEADIDTLKTVKSPKGVFFPQSEDMMRFRTGGGKIEIEDVRTEKGPFVLFGVRACDFKAFSVLDNVFLSEPVDTYYKERRDSAVIFTLACGKPQESCFCPVFGIDATQPAGDVTCWLDEEALYLKANTDKGAEVLALTANLQLEGGEEKVGKIIEEGKKATRPCGSRSAKRVSDAARALSCAPHASVSIYATSGPTKEYCVSAAGIRACIPILLRWRQPIRAPRRCSASVRGLCTSWYTIRRNTADCIRA